MNKFSQRSIENLKNVHPDLKKVMECAIQFSVVDFGITEGYRSPERQYQLYQQGRTTAGQVVTNIDGYTRKSKHNYLPSEAVDIYIYTGDSKHTYDQNHLSYVAGVIMTVADYLHRTGVIKNKIRWGGNWNNRGVIVEGYNLLDMPHFEIV